MSKAIHDGDKITYLSYVLPFGVAVVSCESTSFNYDGWHSEIACSFRLTCLIMAPKCNCTITLSRINAAAIDSHWSLFYVMSCTFKFVSVIFTNSPLATLHSRHLRLSRRSHYYKLVSFAGIQLCKCLVL